MGIDRFLLALFLGAIAPSELGSESSLKVGSDPGVAKWHGRGKTGAFGAAIADNGTVMHDPGHRILDSLFVRCYPV